VDRRRVVGIRLLLWLVLLLGLRFWEGLLLEFKFEFENVSNLVEFRVQWNVRMYFVSIVFVEILVSREAAQSMKTGDTDTRHRLQGTDS
jgi:hypothetical protein